MNIRSLFYINRYLVSVFVIFLAVLIVGEDFLFKGSIPYYLLYILCFLGGCVVAFALVLYVIRKEYKNDDIKIRKLNLQKKAGVSDKDKSLR